MGERVGQPEVEDSMRERGDVIRLGWQPYGHALADKVLGARPRLLVTGALLQDCQVLGDGFLDEAPRGIGVSKIAAGDPVGGVLGDEEFQVLRAVAGV
jgi:hypothetical protein